MQFNKIILENFCGHSKSEIDFSKFQTAVVIGKVRGNDKSSNAVGKSTIFAAIKYVLFNEVEFSTLEKIIRHGCDYCKVSLEFESNNTIYKIIRSKSRKAGSDLRLFKWNNDAWTDLTQRKASDTEKELFKIIKINYKTFCNSVLFSQAEILYGLAAITPSVRKIVLKDALQLGVYANLEKITKKKIIDLSKSIDKEKIISSTLGDPIADLSSIEEELEKNNNLISEKLLELSQIKFKYEHCNTKYLSLTNEFDIFGQKHIEALSKKQLFQNEISKIKSNIVELNSKLSSIQKNKTSLSKISDELSKNIANFSIPSEQVIDDLKEKLHTISQTVIDKKALFKSLSMKLEELSIPLPSDNICKHCRQPMSPEHRQVCKENIESEILQNKQSIILLKKELELFIQDEKALQNKISKIEIDLAKFKNTQDSLSTKLKELSNINSLYGEYEMLHKNEVASLESKIKELDAVKQFLIENKAVDRGKIENAKKLVDATSEQVKNIEVIINAAHSEKAVLLHKKDNRIIDLEKLKLINKNISILDEQYLLHQQVCKAFSSSGIPALITHTILDDFQLETNTLLSQLRPGLQTKFSIIKDRTDGDKEDTLDIGYILNGFELEYEQLSGAQKLIVSLSLKLGLASILKKRLGVDIKILLIDEIDQSLDDNNLEAFEDAIKALQKEYKILIITHNKDLKNNFNTAIVVEQDHNFVSTATVENVW